MPPPNKRLERTRHEWSLSGGLRGLYNPNQRCRLNMTAKLSTEFLSGWLSISLTSVAAGTALSSKTLIDIKRAVENAGASGLLSVGRGVSEANQVLLTSLYLAGFCMFVATFLKWRRSNGRALGQLWLSAAASVLTFTLVLALWIAESVSIIRVFTTQASIWSSGILVFVISSLILASCAFQLRNGWISALYRTDAEQAPGADSP